MARSRVGGDLLLAVPLVLLAFVVPRLATIGVEAPASFPPGPPAAKLAAAATSFETALGQGGSGLRFEIVQTQTLVAKAGGPRIDVPDPADRKKSLGQVDELQLMSLVARGTAKPAGFWSEMRTGPEPGASPDYDGGGHLFGAIARDGKAWRDDGEGWYETDQLPGIGLDPRTVAKLPALLREATSPDVAGVADDAGRAVERVTAGGRVAHIPGVIAADGAAFTELSGPVEIGLDTDGRLATLRVVARNTNEARHELRVETYIRFVYGDPGPIPDPVPAYDPRPTPSPDIPWPPGFTPPPGLFGAQD